MATVFGPLCSWLAQRRARSWAVWFIYGIVLGPIAAGLLLAAPPGRCPSCGTPTRGWARACNGCGLAFDGEEPATAAALDEPPARRAAQPALTAVGPGRATSPQAASAVGFASTGGGAASAQDDVEAAVMESPETRPATKLGRRASAVERRAASPDGASQTVAILASGVFVGGSDGLQIGSRYFLARVGGELHVLGPLHMSPSAIATKMKLNNAEATVVSDRLLLTGRGRASGRTMAFAGVTMEPGMDLQHELAGRRRQRVATS